MESKYTGTSIDTDLLALQKYKEVYDNCHTDEIVDIDVRLDKKYNFLFFPLEEVAANITRVLPPIRQTTHCLTFIKKGSGELSIGQYSFPVKENTLFIVPKEIVYANKYPPTDWSGFALKFTVDFFLNADFPKQCIDQNQFLLNPGQPYIYLDRFQAGTVSNIFECINRENKSDLRNNEMIALKILELLIHCNRLFL